MPGLRARGRYLLSRSYLELHRAQIPLSQAISSSQEYERGWMAACAQCFISARKAVDSVFYFPLCSALIRSAPLRAPCSAGLRYRGHIVSTFLAERLELFRWFDGVQRSRRHVRRLEGREKALFPATLPLLFQVKRTAGRPTALIRTSPVQCHDDSRMTGGG